MAGKQRTPQLIERDQRGGMIAVRVERAAYPIEAVYGAAYEMLDRAWVVLGGAGKAAVRVELRVRGARAAGDLDALAADFTSRLLDHALRVTLAKRHGRVREMIVQQALAGAGLSMDPPPPAPAPGAPTGDDPFDVAGAWEESRTRPPGRQKPQ
jgi:His-Xaa-Ser system protein HxsD